MRELTKSLLSFSWAMPLFGLRQAANLVDPREWTDPRKTASALGSVTTAAREQLGDMLKGTFEIGDRLQRGTIDMVFDLLGGGGERQPQRADAAWTAPAPFSTPTPAPMASAPAPVTGAAVPLPAGAATAGPVPPPRAATAGPTLPLRVETAPRNPVATAWGPVPPGQY